MFILRTYENWKTFWKEIGGTSISKPYICWFVQNHLKRTSRVGKSALSSQFSLVVGRSWSCLSKCPELSLDGCDSRLGPPDSRTILDWCSMDMWFRRNLPQFLWVSEYRIFDLRHSNRIGQMAFSYALCTWDSSISKLLVYHYEFPNFHIVVEGFLQVAFHMNHDSTSH